MERRHLDRIIAAYLQGQANADDVKRLLEWLGESSENKRRFESIKLLWEQASLKVSVSDPDSAFQKIQEKINSDDKGNIRYLNLPDKKKPLSYLIFKGAVAAIIVGLVVAGLFFFTPEFYKERQSQEVAEVATLISANTAGQKSRITLPDGSVAWLNSESVLEYPEEFGKVRELRLQGEAFFEVAKDSLRPFIVKSGPITTTAIGTSFNVESFDSENEIQVSLVTGKVKVEVADKKNIHLDPGYQVKYDKESGVSDSEIFDAEKVIGWTNGILIFDKDNLRDAIKKLERWYAVTIQINGVAPSDFIVTGQFSRNESLENVLENLRYGRDFDYSLKGKEVVISF